MFPSLSSRSILIPLQSGFVQVIIFPPVYVNGLPQALQICLLRNDSCCFLSFLASRVLLVILGNPQASLRSLKEV